MASLPSPETPLNQHSLRALERWLETLGATRSEQDPCDWIWEQPDWRARLRLDQEDLGVIWDSAQPPRSCSFSYRLPRADVEAALRFGP
ncbi:MAG: hypothetical protein CMN94_02225 [Synechococcus sp. EAC657]|nr:hypothetical protein [Synechococcus sp. EAC657]MEC7247917.1 DUF3143 domain-containing protein [Cyanobacteriota bacterium]MEC7898176.1 DUF3143 domain-containing protein [Cyanobacteriota bacterium]MEC8095615.1 DUF3143 domain-containing protein [Cyanobacteriota bacterium]